MRSATSYALVLLLFPLTGCTGETLPVPTADLALRPPDLAHRDLANPECHQLTECACGDRSDCQRVVETCYCPPCGNPPPLCGCAGGRYFGCAPAASKCPPVECRPPQPPTGPDPAGCFRCVPPASCEDARAAILGNCRFSPDYLSGLDCLKNSSCVVDCMNQLLVTCKDVGCGFCASCFCDGNNPFHACVTACQR